MNKSFFSPLLVILFCAGLLCVFTNAASQPIGDTTLLKPGAVLQLISRQFSFTEGPAADREGNIFFTDQPNNRIWKYATDGSLSVFLDSAGRANGLYFDRDGFLLACADAQNQLWQIDSKGKIKVLVNGYKGKKLNGPNDVWAHPAGGIYFTDPYYQRPYWTRQSPALKKENVYYLPKGKRKVLAVIKNLQKPNGIIGSPDGSWLYIADIGAGKTFKYRVKKNGRIGKETLFTAMGSDGMTLDERGNIYLTGNGVTVFDPQGKQIAHIPVREKWTSNVTFGGKNKDQLFITASEAVYVLAMNVKGGK